jgi:hypothetical protein
LIVAPERYIAAQTAGVHHPDDRHQHRGANRSEQRRAHDW